MSARVACELEWYSPRPTRASGRSARVPFADERSIRPCLQAAIWFSVAIARGQVSDLETLDKLLRVSVATLCPFCALAPPIVVTITGNPPAYVIACPECGATGPKQLPGVPVQVAIDAWNRRFGMDH